LFIKNFFLTLYKIKETSKQEFRECGKKQVIKLQTLMCEF